MTLLAQLSSQCGDRSEQSNVKVAFLCLEEPDLLDEIRQGLYSEDALIAGDSAEVMTKVAEEKPALILPFADDLIRKYRDQYLRKYGTVSGVYRRTEKFGEGRQPDIFQGNVSSGRPGHSVYRYRRSGGAVSMAREHAADCLFRARLRDAGERSDSAFCGETAPKNSPSMTEASRSNEKTRKTDFFSLTRNINAGIEPISSCLE